jgi:hypothetical protein
MENDSVQSKTPPSSCRKFLRTAFGRRLRSLWTKVPFVESGAIFQAPLTGLEVLVRGWLKGGCGADFLLRGHWVVLRTADLRSLDDFVVMV